MNYEVKLIFFLEKEYKKSYLTEKQILKIITSEHLNKKQQLQFIKHSLFMSAKYGKSDIVKKIIQQKKEMKLSSSTIEDIIHFQSDIGLYSKPLLNYCNENSDMSSSIEILKLEKDIHVNVKDGMHHLRSQTPRGPLSNWILETYSKLYIVKKAIWIIWLIAISKVAFELGFLWYGFNAYDIMSDISVYHQYSNFNSSVFDIVKAQNCSNDDLFQPEDSHSTYKTASDITLAALIGSGVSYVLNIALANVPRIKGFEGSSWISMTFNFILMLIFFPLIHMAYCVKQLVSNEKTIYQDKTDKFQAILGLLKQFEVCIENNLQLITSLWASRHFTPCLLKNGLVGILKDGLIGLADILFFGIYKANFLQKLIGKLFMAYLSIALSMSLMKMDKAGVEFGQKFSKAIPLFVGYLCQIFTRLCALISLIFMKTTSIKYYISLGFHFLFTFAILIIFETSYSRLRIKVIREKTKRRKVRTFCRELLYILIRVFSSFFILPSDLNKNEVSYTFLSNVCYQILYLTENITLVLLMATHPDLYPDEIKYNVDTSSLIYIVITGWLISAVIQVEKYFYFLLLFKWYFIKFIVSCDLL
jgi:hypothetical protein